MFSYDDANIFHKLQIFFRPAVYLTRVHRRPRSVTRPVTTCRLGPAAEVEGWW